MLVRHDVTWYLLFHKTLRNTPCVNIIRPLDSPYQGWTVIVQYYMISFSFLWKPLYHVMWDTQYETWRVKTGCHVIIPPLINTYGATYETHHSDVIKSVLTYLHFNCDQQQSFIELLTQYSSIFHRKTGIICLGGRSISMLRRGFIVLILSTACRRQKESQGHTSIHQSARYWWDQVSISVNLHKTDISCNMPVA